MTRILTKYLKYKARLLQVLTTFEIPGTVDMWTVYSGQGKLEHAFLILSTAESTMILQTGEEINELDSSGFQTTCPTVFAGVFVYVFYSFPHKSFLNYCRKSGKQSVHRPGHEGRRVVAERLRSYASN